MDTPRIKLTYRREEKTPANLFTDHDWFMVHEQELLERYGECTILIYQEQVVGYGETRDQAAEVAERNLPPEIGIITPMVERLAQRHPFLRVQPKYVAAKDKI